ncbi:hypothetical protein F442_07251, partial [Phytophthora nicotianae P10297]
PQGASVQNPSKIMIEEPMYIIFNVAMSSKWGAQPPNPKNSCRGDGLDPVANAICNSFPMHLKIDYIRVYQDLSSGSNMSIGCDPATHPTCQWILYHLDEYEDDENKLVEVHGKAFAVLMLTVPFKRRIVDVEILLKRFQIGDLPLY